MTRREFTPDSLAEEKEDAVPKAFGKCADKFTVLGRLEDFSKIRSSVVGRASVKLGDMWGVISAAEKRNTPVPQTNMRISTSKIGWFSCVALAILSEGVSGQVLYDIQTAPTTSPLHTGTSGSPGGFVPSGTKLWFVSDMSGNGLSGFGADVAASVFDAISSGLQDDRFFLEATTGFANGTFQAFGIAVPADRLSSLDAYYAILWDETGGAAGTPGAKFDCQLLQYTAPPSPGPGNGLLQIGSDMFADTYTVVPEPAETAAYTGLALLGGAFIWRHRRKSATSQV